VSDSSALNMCHLTRGRQHDDRLVKDFGVDYAMQMIQRLTTEGSVAGVHFCTLNLEKSVQRVLEGLGWVASRAPQHNMLIVVSIT
jgi:methylenetetrahydrofolate reductase (NADPH)